MCLRIYNKCDFYIFTAYSICHIYNPGICFT